MTKRLVDIDDELLQLASVTLGSATMKNTVNEALQLVLRVQSGREHIRALSSGDISDIANPEVMSGAWR